MKYSVSLYSYQTAIETGKMDLEGCLKDIQAMPVPVTGVEVLMKRPEIYQMRYRGMLNKADQDKWTELLSKYGMVGSCYDSVAMGKGFDFRRDGLRRRTNPSLDTLKEQVATLRNEIDYASSLGFTCMRAPYLYGFYEEALRDSLLYAKDKNMILCTEIHAPLSIDGELITKFLEMVDKTCPEAGGIIPDFGIFARRLPAPSIRRALNQGADPSLVELIAETFANGGDLNKLSEEVTSRTEDPNIMYLLRSTKSYVYQDPNKLKPLAKYIRHIHLKWYEVNEEGNELGIDLLTPLKVLKEISYDGYLSAEYEGHIYHKEYDPNESEQIRRALLMTERLLSDL